MNCRFVIVHLLFGLFLPWWLSSKCMWVSILVASHVTSTIFLSHFPSLYLSALVIILFNHLLSLSPHSTTPHLKLSIYCYLITEEWEERWVQSKHKTDLGKFKWSAGKFYGDAEKDKGRELNTLLSLELSSCVSWGQCLWMCAATTCSWMILVYIVPY